MPVHTVWIINKSGGLIYQRTLDDSFHARLSTNDCLVLASTFQSLHAIAAKVSPLPESSGIRHIESSAGFRLHCLQSPTGPKVLLTWTPATPTADKQKDLAECDRILKLIYTLYTDYALKNPFQAPEMPIKSDLFDAALISAIVS